MSRQSGINGSYKRQLRSWRDWRMKKVMMLLVNVIVLICIMSDIQSAS